MNFMLKHKCFIYEYDTLMKSSEHAEFWHSAWFFHSHMLLYVWRNICFAGILVYWSNNVSEATFTHYYFSSKIADSE